MDAYSSFSSSFSRRWTYDVFLSSRDDDTGKKFSDHLYYALKDAGINTFKYDHKLQREEIATDIDQTVEKSRISLLVFSKNYPASTLCLEELVNVMDCKKTVQQVVLPIFYDVDPTDVRKQTGTFAEAFAEHEEHFFLEMDRVGRWRAALTEAANLSGWDLRNVADGHEAKFIKKIVDEILRELNCTYLFVAMYPVGLDVRVQDVNDLLNVGSDDVCIIGICGMGGIGKTTIAKAVHNQFFHCFEGKSFLADVRENFQQPSGQVRLQEQLLSDIMKSGKIKLSGVDHGINVIKERLCNRRVLVILDDIDNLDQLNILARKHDWFGLGSRIIITTRDEQLLKQLEVDAIYRVGELSETESLKLFSWHAFRNAYPVDDYIELSKNVVAYSERLPLALAVLGSFLFKRSIAEWRSALEKLKRIPHGEIQKKLRISFDALSNDQEKDIFLDIACLLIGMDKDYAMKILAGCGFFAKIGISTLARRCLVTINEKNKLMMHDLVRDMGREIVREEFPKFPGKCSRLWHHEDIVHVLVNHMGTEAVEGILLDLPRVCEMHLSSKSFAKMIKLRLLKLNSAHVTGDYGQISKELRWLCWRKFPLKYIPTDFHLENLVALDMRHSSLRQIWKDNKFLGKLKVLNLSHSPYLIKTPDFISLPNLEKLILKDCRCLAQLHQSIGHLHRLIIVNLKDCGNLKSLPRSICKLKSLEILNLFGCSRIEELPEDIGEMESLIELIADGTMIRQVPLTIVHLKNLKKLSLSGCNASPSNSLSSLIWSWVTKRSPKCTNLLPPSLAGLSSLTTLGLSNCRLSDNAIPKDIGTLSSLMDLDIRDNNFHYLPSSISGLPKLKMLQVSNCTKLQFLPELPKTLATLYAEGCSSLEGVSSMSHFQYSPNLFLTNCSSLVEVPCLENLTGVAHMEGCNSLGGTFRESFLKRLSETESGIIYLPGSDIPSWFQHQSMGPSVSFVFPTTSQRRLKGVTLCLVYAIDMDRKKGETYPCLTVINKSKGVDLTFRPHSYEVPNVSQDQICLYHLPHIAFTYQFDTGDQAEVVADLGDGLTVKKCGVYLVFDQDEERDIGVDGGVVPYNLATSDGNANQSDEENSKRSHEHVGDDNDDDGNGDVGPSNRWFDQDPPPKRLRFDPDSSLNVKHEED